MLWVSFFPGERNRQIIAGAADIRAAGVQNQVEGFSSWQIVLSSPGLTR
jgi:hypothetical protein